MNGTPRGHDPYRPNDPRRSLGPVPPGQGQGRPEHGWPPNPSPAGQEFPREPFPQQPGPGQPYPQQPGAGQPYPQQPYPQPCAGQPYPQQSYPQQSYPPQGLPGAPAAGYFTDGSTTLGRRFKPPTLPVVPSNYFEFYLTPSWRWWKPLVAIVFAVVAWALMAVVISLPAVVIQLSQGGEPLAMTPVLFVTNNLSIAAMIGVAALVQFVVFGQRFGWLLSVDGRMHWRWLAICVGVSVIGYAVLQLVSELLAPLGPFVGESEIVAYVVLMLLTTPLQAAAEEVGLRGILPRILTAMFPRTRTLGMWLAFIASSVVFMVLHGAGDIWLNVYYFAFGMAMCVVVWQTGGLAAAIALHVVNNLIAFAITLWQGGMSEVFEREAGTAAPLDIVPQLVLMLALSAVFIALARRRRLRTVNAPGVGQRRPPIGPHLPPPPVRR